jgi:hypothetical protein
MKRLTVATLVLSSSVGCYVESYGIDSDGAADPLLEATTATSSGDSMDPQTDADSTDASESESSGDESCTLDAECDDDVPCTLDVCADRGCMHVPASGVRAPEQTEGDCRVVVCEAGEPQEQPDAEDLPDDDNDCTLDGCEGDAVVHAPEPTGQACAAAAMCDGGGACVECLSPADCDYLPVDDDCQTRTCEAGVCGQSFAPRGAPANATLQTTGDCRGVVCDGAGATISQPANSDLPVDGLECTDDVCTGGVPSNPPLSLGTPCAAGECNAVGQCTGCNEPEDCGESTACQSPTCSVQGVCGVANSDQGTPVNGGQMDGDCQELRCDGDGAIASYEDDDDLPDDDGDACTDDICNGGIAQFPDLPLGTDCGPDGEQCDGAGECVECIEASDCPPASECNVAVCTNDECGVEPAPGGTQCDDELFCTTDDTCNGAGACIGTGDPCPGGDGDGNCSESCDETTNACTAVDVDGSACDDGLFCTATDSCAAGVCGGAAVTCAEPAVCTEECSGCCPA